MRIFSKFHDYYDAVLAYGADERVIYHRNPEIIAPIPEEWEFLIPTISYKEDVQSKHKTRGVRDKYDLRPIVVGLAGKIYHGVGVEKKVSSFEGKNVLKVFWDFDEYQAYMEECGLKLIELKKSHKRSKWGGQREPYWMRSALYEEGAKAWFTVERPDQHREIFINRKVPLVTATRNRYYYRKDTEMELNGSLSRYQFYRRLDAYQTYQELDMFVAGTLTQEDNPMAGIDDKHLAKQKGFDCYSFKKLPSKGPVKKCK